MSTPIIWQPVEVRAFAHHVITTADEIREITPLLRAIARLRVPAHLAPGLHAALEALHGQVSRLDTELLADTKQLWASATASEEMEQAVTAIMTRTPAPTKPRPKPPAASCALSATAVRPP